MRLYKSLRRAAMVLAWMCAAAPVAAETVTPMRATDARASVGVNTHVNYLDTAYARFPQVLDAVHYLGIDHVRELAPMPGLPGTAPIGYYREMMAQGLRIDFVALGGQVDLGKTTVEVSRLAAERPGMVTAIEGFNEVDHAPVTWNGQTGPDAAVAAQKALYAAVRKDVHLKTLPVYDLTGVMPLPVTLAGRADFGNAHLYPQNGYPPDPWFKGMKDLAARDHLPMVVTEFGYASMPQSGWLVIGIGEREQAKGILSGIFSGIEHGYARTYIYELLDEKADPQNSDREWHNGLFDFNFRKKPSAEAVHRLMGLMADPGSAAATFAPRPFTFDMSGLPATAHHVVLEKSDGTTLIVLWNEQLFWDRATGKPIEPPTVAVTVTLPGGAEAQELFDPLQASAPVRIFGPGQPVVVDLPDHPVILTVRR